MWMRYWRVLRGNPDFARLWASQVISLTGDWFNTIVLSALVVRAYPNSEGIAVSLLLLARFVPPLLLSPMAGVLIDRMDRKAILIWSNLLRAFVVLAYIPLLGRPELIGWVYGLVIIQSALTSVFEPGLSSLMNNIVQRDQLVEANTLFNVMWSVMLAFGAALGGIVAEQFGDSTALMVDGLTFFLGAYLIWGIRGYRFTRHVPEQASIEVPVPTSTGVGDGIRYLTKRPNLASLLWVKFGGSLGNVDALMTIYATQVFILGTDGKLSLGIMYSAFGVGAVLGPLLMNRFNDETIARMRVLIVIGFGLATICWLVMGLATSLWVLCLGLLIRAMGTSTNWTYSTAMIQKTADDAYMGRIFSLDMMAFYIATVVSILGHGIVIDSIGEENISLLPLGMTVVAGFVLLVWTLMTRYFNRRDVPPQLQPAASSQQRGLERGRSSHVTGTN
jgi:MFS family permease